MANPDARRLERIDELLDAAGVGGPDSADTVGRVEILIAAWEEMHREARAARDARPRTVLILQRAKHTIRRARRLNMAEPPVDADELRRAEESLDGLIAEISGVAV